MGAVSIGAGVALAAALVSFDSADPSFNRASDGAVANLLGVPGAFAADLLLQTLGLAAALICAALISWGWRLVSHRGIGPLWLRLAALPAGLILAAIALASLSTPASWPLASTLGGFAGSLVLSALASLLSLFGLPTDAGLIGGAAALLSIPALIAGLALRPREWRAAARGLGAMGRALLRPLTRRRDAFGDGVAELRGALGRAARRADEDEEEEAPERVEPSLTRAAAVDIVAPKGAGKAKRKQKAPTQAKLALSPDEDFAAPPLDLLQDQATSGQERTKVDEEALAQNARLLETVLDDFGVNGEIVKVRPGPVVTLYELEPAPGTKSSRVIGLADDIARSMSAVSARVAVVPGRNAIGIELPNARRETVYLRELLASPAFDKAGGLPLALGKDIGGEPSMVDLARMPHLLIAGTTGSGKSVAINTMILSLLYSHTPEECRFIMIDPKMLELSVYDGIPHLLSPVVTEPRKAVVALKWTVKEMESRYRAMSQVGVRNIAGYNQRLAEARRKGEVLTRRVQTGFEPDSGKPVFEEQPLDLTHLPFIVVVVDEMADLMLVAGKDIEGAVQRLAQMARAAGIHLIMATQRPSVDVITGTIKANFPTRVSFQVTSKIDSRTILGEQGAEQLLGQGDMLYMAGGGRITRIHGPFVSDGEVESVVRYLKGQGTPAYVEDVTEDTETGGPTGAMGGEEGDELYEQAVQLVARERKASTSFIQRHLQIGYNRAARLVEQMEADGLISPANHVGRREVLMGGE
ncbi:MAG: cell division protein FtsK [Rhodospirillaceae bacterium]|nr:cell division protein FtsK [Rhodospirillaceae bacterium]